ncbi:Intraflagellar transport protein 81 [Boothiomyces macroporosus]|uniref:Intraflagellar transport protein 81 n=1 Tax=Boothiomyces macroporosus TaxID=261099 RepID=A0AAD5UE71_9FUNG|nr:Intraflagellar transport protein 81 [Boothiomyces macroporosus]
MTYLIDLKVVSSVINSPPFSKKWSIIQLHDEIPNIQLVQTLFEVAGYIDSANNQSIFMLDRDLEEKALRLCDFMQMLNCKEAQDIDGFITTVMAPNRQAILYYLTFLLKDLATHKKRAYLAQFLSIPEIPSEFSQDDVIIDLTNQIEQVQEEFRNTHRYLDGLKQSGPNSTAVKREIQQMEEEKQQLLSKITRIQKKIQGVPKSEQWLQAARNLRTEQQHELALVDRLREQRAQVSQADAKYTNAVQKLKTVKANLMNSSPESIFAKMEEEHGMNRFLSQENFPKNLMEAEVRIRDLNEILAQPSISEQEFAKLEAEIAKINNEIVELAEKKLKISNSGDANLALFRQQAQIIARKKEGTLAKLPAVQEELANLQKQAAEKEMLQGEDFKRYVSELRGKSTNYKRKKAELSSLTAEFGILQRTEEVHAEFKQTIQIAEQRSGVVGYHDAQTNLEKVSEMKSEVDQEKGKTLDQISSIIQQLNNSINEKKNQLAPVIQNLRALRQEAQELDNIYTEKKRIYDTTMIGLESENSNLDQEIRNLRNDIRNDHSRYHHLNQLIQQSEIAQDRVMNEMKAYIGADDMIELIQKARGFKTYRDLYNRKIAELENNSKILQEQQKEAKIKHEPNMKQIQMFNGIKKLLTLKIANNKKIISGRNQEDKAVVTMDRLVLS